MKKILFCLTVLCFIPFRAFASSQEESWNQFSCEHFFIYYRNAPMDFVVNVSREAEDEYDTIARTLGFTRYEGWSWDRRAKIYIYDDQETYVNSRNMSWSHGTASVKEKIIRTFPTAHGFFDSTLPHELGHIIFHEFVGFEADIPTWLDEGVAMYQEKARRWGANTDVQKAMAAGRFIPLKQLTYIQLTSSSSQDLVELFYAEAASVVYFMMTELGEYRFVNFCRNLKNGVRFEDAMHRAYARFRSLDDLDRAWEDYLTK